MHTFELTVTWTETVFPIKPTRLRLYAHLSCVAIRGFASAGTCLVDGEVMTLSPNAEQFAALDESLKFAQDTVDIRMIEDTSDAVATMSVRFSRDGEDRQFHVNAMASGIEGDDVDAFLSFLRVLGSALRTDLAHFTA